LNPPLLRNVKADRGFHHERTGALLCPTGLDWSNPEYVPAFVYLLRIYLLSYFASTKEKLKSGELVVAGDQWPMFLYEGYVYDPDDPWKGLFRSSLLVSVCLSSFASATMHLDSFIFTRLSNISSHHLVQLIRNPRPRVLEMRAFMG
jgi:hypothetical protein